MKASVRVLWETNHVVDLPDDFTPTDDLMEFPEDDLWDIKPTVSNCDIYDWDIQYF